MNREWLVAQATTLGVEFNEDTTDEQLAELVATRMSEIVVPLNEATEQATRERQFEQDYPEQARMLQELAQREREGAASAFASNYERFAGQSRGFAPVVRDQIEEAHELVARRSFTHAHLASLLDAVSQQASIVTYGELGSARSSQQETPDGTPTGDFTTDRQRFAELVKQAMTDDNLSRQAALEHVSKTHPELAKSYMSGHVRR